VTKPLTHAEKAAKLLLRALEEVNLCSAENELYGFAAERAASSISSAIDELEEGTEP
jgi:hypothetical protein